MAKILTNDEKTTIIQGVEDYYLGEVIVGIVELENAKTIEDLELATRKLLEDLETFVERRMQQMSKYNFSSTRSRLSDTAIKARGGL